MYINVIWATFRYSLRVFNIYSVHYVCYRFWALAVSIGTPCKHCCQSMTLALLTSKNRNSTYIPEINFFISALYIIITFFLQRTVKISIFLLYNLDMRYRLNLLSTQSVQPLLRSDNLGSSQLLVSRKDTRSAWRYAWIWREILPCFLIFFLRYRKSESTCLSYAAISLMIKWAS